MAAYLRFRIGPFVISDRLGRTQAQKRAAAKKRAARAKFRAQKREVHSPQRIAEYRRNIAEVASYDPRNLAQVRTVTRADRRWLKSPEGAAAVQAIRDDRARRARGAGHG